MTDQFFSAPILNSPFEPPARHWELDPDGQPTQPIIESRRKADFITPIPKAKKRGKGNLSLALDEGGGLSTADQSYLRSLINELRVQVERWRALSDPSNWNVTLGRAYLLTDADAPPSPPCAGCCTMDTQPDPRPVVGFAWQHGVSREPDRGDGATRGHCRAVVAGEPSSTIPVSVARQPPHGGCFFWQMTQ